jgi:hypothetical protein
MYVTRYVNITGDISNMLVPNEFGLAASPAPETPTNVAI